MPETPSHSEGVRTVRVPLRSLLLVGLADLVIGGGGVHANELVKLCVYVRRRAGHRRTGGSAERIKERSVAVGDFKKKMKSQDVESECPKKKEAHLVLAGGDTITSLAHRQRSRRFSRHARANTAPGATALPPARSCMFRSLWCLTRTAPPPGQDNHPSRVQTKFRRFAKATTRLTHALFALAPGHAA